MKVYLRKADLRDAPFLADVVIQATLAQGRFPADTDMDEYRIGFEEWTCETITKNTSNCTLSVIELDDVPIGRLRVLRDQDSITLAGIQLLPGHQNKGIGTMLVEALKHEAGAKRIPLYISVEKDNPNARRLYTLLGCILRTEDERDYHLEYRP